MVPLENKEVAALFETTLEKDLEIITLGYAGWLSKVSMIGAVNMMASCSQYLKAKTVDPIVEIPQSIIEQPIIEPQNAADIVTTVTVEHESTAHLEHVEPTQ